MVCGYCKKIDLTRYAYMSDSITIGYVSINDHRPTTVPIRTGTSQGSISPLFILYVIDTFNVSQGVELDCLHMILSCNSL